MSSINSVLGVAGTHRALQSLERSSETWRPYDAVVELLVDHGCPNPSATIEELVKINLLHRNPDGFAITQFGVRTAILLDAINGADLRETWRRLTRIYPDIHNYELIRNRLIGAFLDNLAHRPGFGRIYLCSPWISLDKRHHDILAHALLLAESGYAQPEALVITRPKEGTREELAPSAAYLKDLGAEVFLNRNLHTKLYIREPGPSGGLAMAILGSQNLTRSRYLELGIRIHSDTVIIQNLIRYFLDIIAQSDEAG